MAQFMIFFRNDDNKVIESVSVVGCKERDYVVARHSGKEEALRYDHYYVKKPNQYGIKWIVLPKGKSYGTTISADGKVPSHNIDIHKV